jgi:MoxR-like ATPase
MDRDHVEAILAATTGHALLYGPRGVAKTTTAVQAARPGQVVFQTTFTAEASAAQHLGHYVPKGPEFVWHKGPFQRAWEEGGLLVINEIDHASEDVSNLLHALLDDGLGAYLTLPTGDTIHPAPGFRCIATMNGVPGDLAAPVRDRFKIVLPVTKPSKGQLDSLPPDVRETCKNLYERGQHETTTFRMLAAFVQLRDELEPVFGKGRAEEIAAGAIYGDMEQGKALLKAIALNRATPGAPR